jgi:hypothetical protein
MQIPCALSLSYTTTHLKKDVFRYFDIQEYFITYDEHLLKADIDGYWSIMQVGHVTSSFQM